MWIHNPRRVCTCLPHPCLLVITAPQTIPSETHQQYVNFEFCISYSTAASISFERTLRAPSLQRKDRWKVRDPSKDFESAYLCVINPIHQAIVMSSLFFNYSATLTALTRPSPTTRPKRRGHCKELRSCQYKTPTMPTRARHCNSRGGHSVTAKQVGGILLLPSLFSISDS